MALEPKQLRGAGANPGQALTWNGRRWAPGDDLASLKALVLVQGEIIRSLAEALQNERFRLPPELEEFVNGTV